MKKHSKNNMNGLSFTLVFGSYAGFFVIVNKEQFRICLGWVAFTIYFCDFEKFIDYLRNKNGKNR
jgi:hypothetical protein